MTPARRSSWILIASVLFVPTLPAQSASMEAGLAHIEASRWGEAVAVFEMLARENPYEGTIAHYLALSLSRSGQCERAIPAFHNALRLGANGGVNALRIGRVMLASCYAQRGDSTAALAQLDTAWRRHGLRDFTLISTGPRFASIIGTEHYRGLAGIPPQPLTDRAARWRFDLHYLDDLVRQTHPAPFHAVTEQAWTVEVAWIAEQVPALTDEQVIAAMMRLMSRVGDGHTALYPPMAGPGAWQLLPIWPVMLADGWHVGAAPSEHRSLVGGKLLGAGGQDIATLDSVARSFLAADNGWTGHWLVQIPLQIAQFYRLAGAANSDGSVTLRVLRADGREEEVTVRPVPVDRDPNARWAPRDWPAMGGNGSAAPRWIRYSDRPVAVEWLPRQKVVYIALNTMLDAEGFQLASYGAVLRDSILAHRPDGIVLDLRLNNGGDGSLVPPFLRPLLAIEKLQEPGAFQVLTGPRTYSATMFLLNELDRFTELERVGWPTGGRPVAYASETPFKLPLSGLEGSISARLEIAGWSASDARPHVGPREAVWPTGEALRRGTDPVLEAALKRIANRPK